ncbi:MAG TPA: ABC transporter permease [Fimbriimonadaceae bacterium]|nr:ABC transporter permease [Fimbriimonadaceae bacterium]HRJ33037.1 ABC transporter permease [Fimbriimonadaceae bacterium]
MIKKIGGFLWITLGLVAILLLTFACLGIPVFRSAGLIAQGSFGTWNDFTRTLVKTTPLLLTALGVLVAWRAGMYNIGGEGQFVIGGLSGAAVAQFAPGLPPSLMLGAILLATVLGGALYAGLAGWLHVKRGVQVVVSTILLNFIALEVLDWAVRGPLQEKKKQLPLTDLLAEGARLPRFSSQNDLHAGVIVAGLAVVIVGIVLFRTAWGYRVRLTGSNPGAAQAAGLRPGRIQVQAMMVSGALCGLAGGIEYTGMTAQIGTDLAQNWGFLAIPAALLGMLHPLGAGLASLYFGALFAGSKNLEAFTKAGSTIVFVVQAVAVLGFVWLSRWSEERALRREAEA